MDELIHSIISRNVIDLCYKVCMNYIENKKRTLNMFIEIYAKYYSHSNNQILLTNITSRLSKLDSNTYDGSRIIVELFLLLYNSHIHYFPVYDSKTTKHTINDLSLLLMDHKNVDECKNICASYCKNDNQTKISFNDIDEKYKNECIWLVWYELFKIGKNINDSLFEYVKEQFSIFTYSYNKIESNKRINIIYNILIKLSQHVLDTNTEVWYKEHIIKRSFLEIMFKINIIYEELGYNHRMNKKTYIHSCCMVMYPNNEDIKQKLEVNYIPESKKLKLQEQNKIHYDNVIKVKNDSY